MINDLNKVKLTLFLVIILTFPSFKCLSWSSGVISEDLYMSTFDTHRKIDEIAYKQIIPTGQLGNFPSLESIQSYEGLMGPDGALIRLEPEGKDSFHYYNPQNGKGDAPAHVQLYYYKLVDELVQINPNLELAAKYAAWMAHFVADCLDPAHHIGDYQNPGSIDNNWYDPIWDNVDSMWSLKNRHLWFEVHFLFHSLSPLYKWKADPIDWSFIQLQQKLTDPNRIQDYIKKKAKEIYDLHIYELFLLTSWNSTVIKAIDNEVMPKTISAIATLWLSASQEAEISRINIADNL